METITYLADWEKRWEKQNPRKSFIRALLKDAKERDGEYSFDEKLWFSEILIESLIFGYPTKAGEELLRKYMDSRLK